MDRLARFRRDLVVSGFVMAVGVIMMIAPSLISRSFPVWWPRTASLLTICGACAELIAVVRFARRIGPR
jgi:hypothetical protein